MIARSRDTDPKRKLQIKGTTEKYETIKTEFKAKT